MGVTNPRAPVDERPGRVVVLGVIAMLVLVGVYFALGMPGMDHSGNGMAEMSHAEKLQELSPRLFEARVSEGDAFVVNVHVPVDRSIEGTDEAIAFDEILESMRLPTNKAVPILLYCESGRMSRIAGRALLQAGYSDVSHLAGGLQAWRRAGLELSLPSMRITSPAARTISST